jgi:hypothetical protein
MKTFYTIIKIAANTLAGDTLSIGLLLYNGDQFWLQFSDERKSVAKKLLDTNADIVDFAAKQLQNKVDEMNKSISEAYNSFFEANDILGIPEFKHISNYSNGVLRFSQPAFLNDTVTDEKFQKLFSLLVDKLAVKAEKLQDTKDAAFREKIQTKLIKRVEHKVHTNLELTPKLVHGLYYNFNIDCLGLNGAFVAAKSIPFHKKYESIDRELGHYFALMSILKLTYERKSEEDNFYIIADEPSEIDSKEHRTWENIKQNPAVKLIFTEQSEIVAEKIEDKKAHKFLADQE